MSETTPDEWPPDVTPIGIEDLGRLGLNRRHQLFWNGKRIEVRNRLDLTRLEKTLAIIVSFFAILGATGSFVTGLNSAATYLCARDIHWVTCPPQPLLTTPLPTTPLRIAPLPITPNYTPSH